MTMTAEERADFRALQWALPYPRPRALKLVRGVLVTQMTCEQCIAEGIHSGSCNGEERNSTSALTQLHDDGVGFRDGMIA